MLLSDGTSGHSVQPDGRHDGAVGGISMVPCELEVDPFPTGATTNTRFILRSIPPNAPFQTAVQGMVAYSNGLVCG